jgi:hypothetical protein
MGAWGVLAFDNDIANDWAYELDDADDLSVVESALADLDDAVEEGYIDSDVGGPALAACEVLARLLGNPGYTNAYTEKVDEWVAAHPQAPSAALLKRADAAIDRVLGDNSELAKLWSEAAGDWPAQWRASVEDLRRRLRKQ